MTDITGIGQAPNITEGKHLHELWADQGNAPLGVVLADLIEISSTTGGKQGVTTVQAILALVGAGVDLTALQTQLDALQLALNDEINATNADFIGVGNLITVLQTAQALDNLHRAERGVFHLLDPATGNTGDAVVVNAARDGYVFGAGGSAPDLPMIEHTDRAEFDLAYALANSEDVYPDTRLVRLLDVNDTFEVNRAAPDVLAQVDDTVTASADEIIVTSVNVDGLGNHTVTLPTGVVIAPGRTTGPVYRFVGVNVTGGTTADDALGLVAPAGETIRGTTNTYGINVNRGYHDYYKVSATDWDFTDPEPAPVVGGAVIEGGLL